MTAPQGSMISFKRPDGQELQGYLAKPANADDIEAAFGRMSGDALVPLTPRRTTLKTLEWERIHETLVETNFNVSETARRLGMHRRTLARKLAKRPVP